MSASVDSAAMQCKGARLRHLLFGAEQADKAGHVLKAQAPFPFLRLPSGSETETRLLRILLSTSVQASARRQDLWLELQLFLAGEAALEPACAAHVGRLQRQCEQRLQALFLRPESRAQRCPPLASHEHANEKLRSAGPAGLRDGAEACARCSGRCQGLAGALGAAGAEDLVFEETPARPCLPAFPVLPSALALRAACQEGLCRLAGTFQKQRRNL